MIENNNQTNDNIIQTNDNSYRSDSSGGWLLKCQTDFGNISYIDNSNQMNDKIDQCDHGWLLKQTLAIFP